jgi:murein DD-endopeptidase MepM/ murein hydrolase activator NlpD
MATKTTQPGVLPDIFQSMPDVYKKPSEVPVYDYNTALKSRLAPIGQAGQTQGVFASQERQKVDDAAYAKRMGQLQAASNPQTWGIQQTQTTGAKTGAVQGTGSTGPGGWFNPVAGFKPNFGYGQTYKNKSLGTTHHGIDLPTPVGTPIYAPSTGQIVLAGWDPYGGKSGGFGTSVRMRNADGTYTIIGHMSNIDGHIQPGQPVRAGQLLGYSGRSGNASGAHVHIEMRHSLYDPSSSFNFGSYFGW